MHGNVEYFNKNCADLRNCVILQEKKKQSSLARITYLPSVWVKYFLVIWFMCFSLKYLSACECVKSQPRERKTERATRGNVCAVGIPLYCMNEPPRPGIHFDWSIGVQTVLSTASKRKYNSSVCQLMENVNYACFKSCIILKYYFALSRNFILNIYYIVCVRVYV